MDYKLILQPRVARCKALDVIADVYEDGTFIEMALNLPNSWPFNTAPYVMVTPPHQKIFFITTYNCNLVTVMNWNVNIW